MSTTTEDVTVRIIERGTGRVVLPFVCANREQAERLAEAFRELIRQDRYYSEIIEKTENVQ